MVAGEDVQVVERKPLEVAVLAAAVRVLALGVVIVGGIVDRKPAVFVKGVAQSPDIWSYRRMIEQKMRWR